MGWKSNEEILRSTGLILTDMEKNKEGITLAAILLFGKDTSIMSVLPQYKTDAIYRVKNLDRYDDREVIITNLLDSYDILMKFGRKHLNDSFVMEGIQSISARDKILREIISNLLEHRDFSSGYPAKLIIENDKIVTENANLSHGNGELKLDTFEPFPKNPAIAKVFREIGYADELGSGMRNTNKYTKMYSGGTPIFEEGDVFVTTIPLFDVAKVKTGPLGNVNQTNEQEVVIDTIQEAPDEIIREEEIDDKILQMIAINNKVTKKDIARTLNVSEKTIERHMKDMKNIEFVGRGFRGYWRIKE
jgi:ATP-dependent DNA helicase RecG